MRAARLSVLVSLWATAATAQIAPMPGSSYGIPDQCATPTITAVASGNWAAPATWTPARVPTATDKVSIPHGLTVTVDAAASALCLGVHGALDSSGQALTVGTLYDYADGSWTLKDHGRVTVMDEPLDTTADPEQFGTGLIILGAVDVEGAAKTEQARMTTEIQPGATSFTLAAPVVGWMVGDRIRFADPQEEVTITSLSGQTVVFTPAAANSHLGAHDHANVMDRQPPVVNLTRSVVFASANPGGTRGHLMFTGNATGTFSGVDVQDMGRTQPLINTDDTTWSAPAPPATVTHIGTNQKGRYAVHFHYLTGHVVVTDNVIERAAKWGLAIHHTNGQTVTHNVVAASGGDGYMFEDGTEINNVLTDNVAFGTTGTDQRPDWQPNDRGTEGSGFWIVNGNNQIERNLAADCAYAGFLLVGDDGLGIYPQSGPIVDFTDNEAIHEFSGLSIWMYRNGGDVTNFKSWGKGTGQGIFAYPLVNVTFTNFYFRTDRDATFNQCCRNDTGFTAGDYAVTGLKLIKPDIQNARIGIDLPYGGMYPADNPSEVDIEGGYLNNLVDIQAVHQPLVGGGAPFAWTYHDDGVTHAGPTQVKMWADDSYVGNAGTNFFSLMRYLVTNYNGVTGDTFQVFATTQAPDHVLGQEITGPDAGLTNAQAWAKDMHAVNGELATCNTVRTGIAGFACPAAAPPPPPPPVLPTLTGVTLTPSTVQTGQAVTLTVTLSAAAPAGGSDVTLTSSLAGFVVPATLTVAEGATTASTTITPTAAGAVTVTASYNGTTLMGTETITAPPPPPPPSTTLTAAQLALAKALQGLWQWLDVQVGPGCTVDPVTLAVSGCQ